MPDTGITPQIETLLQLLLIASATAISLKWIRMPYSVALVIAGLVIGLSGVMKPIYMTPDLVLVLFLPALLFEASWDLDVQALRRDWRAIAALATIGVFTCMVAVAAVLHYLGGVGIAVGLLLGAILSATDPVSVVALFRRIGMPKRLTMLLEGESIFNDGTAVVMFKIVLAIVVSGGAFSLSGTIFSFIYVIVGGAIVGSLVGFVSSLVTRMVDDHLLETMLTMVAAYGSFLIADDLGVSQIISVVTAGIIVGNFGSTCMSQMTRHTVDAFWEYAAFIANSLLFLLIGLQLNPQELWRDAVPIALAVSGLILARVLAVYGISPAPFGATRELPIPMKWRHLLCWGGLRGALCMALALSVPMQFSGREQIVNVTFGVVLFTLLIQGLTMEPLVKLLGVTEADQTQAQADQTQAQADQTKQT
jgi:CPA1 family monovalent cation:H+ antiporter